MRLVSWAMLASTVWAMPSNAQNVSGNELLEICQDQNQAAAGFCIGYVSGLVEGLKWGAAVPIYRTRSGDTDIDAELVDQLSSSLLGICLPPDAQLAQFRDVIIQYLERNPQDRHTSARLLGHLALSAAFPCEPE